jgi:hypothetical protein
VSKIYWLQQRQENLPEKNNWLGPGELLILNSLLFLKRRTEWRLGRWTAKCAFARMHGMPLIADVLAHIEIRAAASGAPQVFILGAQNRSPSRSATARSRRSVQSPRRKQVWVVISN